MSANQPLVILVSAPSGAGKTTLCENVLEAEAGMQRAITCTTRAPREGEQDGVHYHFLTLEDFEKRLSAGEFLEHAQVYQYRYGTLKREVMDRLKAGHDVLLNIDVQGAESVRAIAQSDQALGDALVTVFLTVGTMEELEQRLQGRGSDAPEVVQRRLAAARDEIAQLPKFDYVIISGTRDEDLSRLRAIITAERLRTRRAWFPGL